MADSLTARERKLILAAFELGAEAGWSFDERDTDTIVEEVLGMVPESEDPADDMQMVL